MSLPSENGGMVMPVSPMYGNGYGNDMFGGNGWWVLLFLWALCGNNGFGGMGNGMLPYFFNTQTQNDVNRGFDNSGLSSQIAAVQSSVNDLQTTNQLNGIQSAVANGFSQAEIAACGRAASAQQTAYQNILDLDTRLDGISSALQKCCCDNELAISQVRNDIATQAAENRFQAANNTRDIITNATANTQAILDKMCQMEIDQLKSENANLRTQVQMQNLQATQAAQTGQLMADNAAQTQQLINRIAPYPIPSYPVGNPYGYYYNNGFNGCGCGCGMNQGIA